MPAILTAYIKIRDPDKFAAYIEQAIPTIVAHGGEPLFRASVAKTLRGTADYMLLGAFRFPDAATIETWYASDAYRVLHAARDEAADVTFVINEEM
jgi:uncharacterized protein (DUF1330 family)